MKRTTERRVPSQEREKILVERIVEKEQLWSNKILGEHTEKVRKDFAVVEDDGDLIGVLKGTTCEENKDRLDKSLVGIAIAPSSSTTIQAETQAQCVHYITILPMGGMQHLITFTEIEDEKAMIENGGTWLQGWFQDLREWDKEITTNWRETWIICVGMPLHAWSYENFFNVGSFWEKVLSMDNMAVSCSQLVSCRVHIVTDYLLRINDKVYYKVEGKNTKSMSLKMVKLQSRYSVIHTMEIAKKLMRLYR